jgi:hypothetical protein
MSQESNQKQLEAQTQHLLRGPLQHIRRAALAAALLPLASVAAAPAAAQSAACASAGMGGYVWNDANRNGLQDLNESGVPGAVVTVNDGHDPKYVIATDEYGYYSFYVAGASTEIAVQIPPGTEPAPADVGDDETIDSDGVADGVGNSVATVTYVDWSDCRTDFGFFTSSLAQPGTGTPGYWKNHPEAWPVAIVTVGGIEYSRDQAIRLLDTPGKDRTITMFSSLVPAMLNVKIGNDSSCVASTIKAANEWMQTFGPVGSGVHAASYAWKVGEPLHRLMDNYNNGMLCAPHRD